MKKLLIVVCLLVLGVSPGASAAVVVPAWPYPEKDCAERARTAPPDGFGAPVVFGGDEHTNITGVAFGRFRGRSVAVSTGQEGTMRMWGLPGLTPIGEPVKSATIVSGGGLVLDPEPEPTGRLNGRPVRVTADDRLRVLDAGTGREVGPVVELGEDNSVLGMVVFPMGGTLVAAIADTGGDECRCADQLDLRDLASGELVGAIDGHFSTVRAATVDGALVLVTVNTGFDPGAEGGPRRSGSVSIWNPVTRAEIARLPGNPPPPVVEDSASSNTEVRLAVGTMDGEPVALTGGFDNTLRLWDLTTAAPIAATRPNGHVNEVGTFTVGEQDGRRVVVSVSVNGTLLMWDLVTGARLGMPVFQPDWRPASTEMPERPPLLLDGSPVRVDAEPTGQGVVQRLLPLMSGWVVPFGDGFAAISGQSGWIRLRDLATREHIGTAIRVTGPNPLSQVTLAELGGRPVLIDVREWMTLWDLYTGRRIGTIPDVRSSGHRNAPPAVGHARCTTVALTGSDTGVRVWDLRTGRELFRLTGHGGRVHQIRYGTIGDLPIAVTAGEDGTARVWNLADGKQIGAPIAVGFRYGMIQLTYWEGRTLLIGAGRDERVRRWDLGR
ncbi:hypothetical protein Acor_72650 [Acrocarpospora corrugata]|uniref:WD40 repeat domain-containing protein n=1 Tax=Acrocarpospora corrugata TaxID=35763 RepID=A0A5M3W801_9ACTN|nr:WD40 repeat domain-containing protein [Acrocarpospora corrugata]GES05197.1 hypothetical protein Acor_72650 [Acrocarpospora corrugata]